jgi:protein TonB
MLESLRSLKPEQLSGLLFVLALHGAGLYGLWRYHLISEPAEAVTLMVDLINPPPSDKPKPPQPEPPRPKPRIVEPPKPRQLVAETAVVLPDEPLVPPQPALPPAPVAQVEVPQVLMLSGELSVSCPERSPPVYPAQSMRLNEQGRVVLRVELGVDGYVSNVAFKTRSGFNRLDEAAVAAVKIWRCKPAYRGSATV